MIPNTHIEQPLTPAPSEPPPSSDHTYEKEILKKIFAQPLKPTRILSPWQPCVAVNSSLLGNVCTMLPTLDVHVYVPHCLHKLSSGALETIFWVLFMPLIPFLSSVQCTTAFGKPRAVARTHTGQIIMAIHIS